MKKDLEKRLDGVYTRIFMRAQNLSWKNHHTLADISGNIIPISRRLASKRYHFVGHCFRDKSQVISNLFLWNLLLHRKGKRLLNYIDAFSRDTIIDYEELPTAMSDRTY